MNKYYNPYAQNYCRMPENAYGKINTANNQDVEETQCECRHKDKTALPENPVAGMAYVPFQTEFEVYDAMKALKFGTIFPELNKPFTGCCRYE